MKAGALTSRAGSTAESAVGGRAFFTPRALAEYLSVSERTIREMVRTGELASYKVAGSRRIAAEDVESYLAEHRTEEHV